MPRLLAIIPHPDDESYSFGGTIALAARAGWECLVECASFGERGKRHDGGDARPNAVAEIREAELEASCRALGAGPPIFWGLPDGEFRLHKGEHARITRLFSRTKPDLVLSLGADGAYGHPDHVALFRWILQAWQSLPADEQPALLLAAFPKGLFLPQWLKCLKMMGMPPNPRRDDIGSPASNYEVPIASVAQAKLSAISAHRSQLADRTPQSLFPPGIVDALLESEGFTDATGQRSDAVAELLSEMASRKAGKARN
jgi:LmbE family N-acetylglucosaminyl deacetylase